MLAAVLIHQETVFENGWDAILAGNSISTSEKLLELLEYDVRFSVEHRDFISVWHAYWGEAKGSSLYRKLSHPRDERYERDARRLLSNLTEEGKYDDINVTAVERGINAMMFGIWRDSHLTHGPNDYNNGIQAMYVYLHKLFPQHYKRKVFRKKSRKEESIMINFDAYVETAGKYSTKLSSPTCGLTTRPGISSSRRNTCD